MCNDKDMPKDVIVLSRLSDSDAFGFRTIKIALTADIALSYVTATFTLLNFVQEFTSAEVESKELILVFKKEDVSKLPVGPAYGSFKMTDANGNVLSVVNNIKFFITNQLSVFEGAEIKLEPITSPALSATIDVKFVISANASVNYLNGKSYPISDMDGIIAALTDIIIALGGHAEVEAGG